MFFVEVHTMRYEYDEHTALWSCPECGRVVQVHPELKVLEKGDMSAIHSGSSGGVLITGVEVSA